MASLPTQFSVTSTRTCPVRNPEASLPLPRAYETEDIRSPLSPFVVTSISEGSVSAPISRVALAIASVLPPTLTTGIAQPSIPLPSLPTSLPVISVGTPTSRTRRDEANTPAPTTITPNTGTRTTPPFPLNHARILHDNLLTNASSISVTEGDNNGQLSIIPNTFQRWTFSANGRIFIDLPQPLSMDTVCIGGHNIGGGGYTVQAFYRETPTGPQMSFSASVTPTNNNAIMFHVGTAVDVSELEIRVTGGASGYIGYISAGVALQMQRPFFNGHTPITDATVSQFYTSYTETFSLIAKQKRRVGQQTSAEWKNLDDTWYRTMFEPVKEQLEATPYFFAWNLLQFPNDVGFVQTEVDIRATYNGVNELRNLSIPMRGTR